MTITVIVCLGVLFQLEPWQDVHGLELLEEQLARVRDLDVADGGAGAAVMAPARVGQKAALVAHVYAESVAGDHKPLDQQHACPIRWNILTMKKPLKVWLLLLLLYLKPSLKLSEALKLSQVTYLILPLNPFMPVVIRKPK